MGGRATQVFNVHTLVVKFASCALAVGSGLPVGPEGPMVHIGAMVGAALSQGHSTTLGFDTGLFKRFQNPKDKRDFVTAGASPRHLTQPQPEHESTYLQRIAGVGPIRGSAHACARLSGNEGCHSASSVRQQLLACSMGNDWAVAGHAGTAVGIATAFGAPIGGLLFAFEELASSFSQALGWQIFFACMLAVLTLDTFKSAQHALRRGHFGLFDGDASTVFFEVCRAVFLSAVQASHIC